MIGFQMSICFPAYIHVVQGHPGGQLQFAKGKLLRSSRCLFRLKLNGYLSNEQKKKNKKRQHCEIQSRTHRWTWHHLTRNDEVFVVDDTRQEIKERRNSPTIWLRQRQTGKLESFDHGHARDFCQQMIHCNWHWRHHREIIARSHHNAQNNVVFIKNQTIQFYS